MSEGVGIDMGTPGAHPMNSEGQPLPPRVRFTLEVDEKEAKKVATNLSAMGEQAIADRICQTAGIPTVRANLVERHLFIAGTLTGIGAVAAGYGAYRLYRYIQNRRAMPAVTDEGKVIPLPRVARR